MLLDIFCAHKAFLFGQNFAEYKNADFVQDLDNAKHANFPKAICFKLPLFPPFIIEDGLNSLDRRFGN